MVKQYSLSLDEFVIAKIDVIAENQKRSRSWIVNDILKERVDKCGQKNN